ncbi:uncharacterized protein TNCV_4592271 [Trichonephila clavipes]|nr:uncharacterized protein TNCV_4592271 [Trichonephila clavipes]
MLSTKVQAACRRATKSVERATASRHTNSMRKKIQRHVISVKREKADLIKLAIELGECESNGKELKIIELRTKILTNDAYKEDPEFVKCIFEEIVSNRIDEENKQKEQTLREFELQNIIKSRRSTNPTPNKN